MKEIEIEKEDKKEIMDHEVDCAMQDIMRAEKWKKDPKMMKAVQEKLNSLTKTIGSLDDLKAAKKEAMLKKPEMDEEEE